MHHSRRIGSEGERSRTTPASRAATSSACWGRRLDHDAHERLGPRLSQQDAPGPVERGLLVAHGGLEVVVTLHPALVDAPDVEEHLRGGS